MKKQRKSEPQEIAVPTPSMTSASTDRLLADVRTLIDAARQQVAQAVNAGLVHALLARR